MIIIREFADDATVCQDDIVTVVLRGNPERKVTVRVIYAIFDVEDHRVYFQGVASDHSVHHAYEHDVLSINGNPVKVIGS